MKVGLNINLIWYRFNKDSGSRYKSPAFSFKKNQAWAIK